MEQKERIKQLFNTDKERLKTVTKLFSDPNPNIGTPSKLHEIARQIEEIGKRIDSDMDMKIKLLMDITESPDRKEKIKNSLKNLISDIEMEINLLMDVKESVLDNKDN